jgi:adenylyltransferase/sulfurtransferase
MYQSITPKQAIERLKAGEQFRFIDVREPQEYAVARVEQAELLPLTRFNEWIDSLDADEEIVVMCHHGIRSANVCMYLTRNGFEKVFNLEGGIDLWSIEADENIPRY